MKLRAITGKGKPDLNYLDLYRGNDGIGWNVAFVKDDEFEVFLFSLSFFLSFFFSLSPSWNVQDRLHVSCCSYIAKSGCIFVGHKMD